MTFQNFVLSHSENDQTKYTFDQTGHTDPKKFRHLISPNPPCLSCSYFLRVQQFKVLLVILNKLLKVLTCSNEIIASGNKSNINGYTRTQLFCSGYYQNKNFLILKHS